MNSRLPRLGYGGAAALLIIAVAALRLAYLAFWRPLDLSPDEAHYWDWSRHLDWSYYSKGPLVAYLIRTSCWLFGDLARTLSGTEMAAVRLPAVVCGSLLLWGLYRLTVETFDRPKWGFAVVVVALTLPVISAGAYIMTIDAPYTCAWIWALVFCRRALFESANLGWWFAAGVCVALGVLAKHTMVLFVPMLGLFLLAARFYRADAEGNRSRLRLSQPGFWLMAGVGALGGLPILFWNMRNDWVTWRHTRGHAGLAEGPALHWAGPLHYVSLQAALLLGYWFVAWVAAAWAHRPGNERRPQVGFLWWMSVPMFAFFALFSLKNGGGEANWPITAYLSGLVLVLPWLSSHLTSPLPVARHATRLVLGLFCAMGLTLSLAMHDTRLLFPLLSHLAAEPDDREPTPMRRLDPTCRLKGWRTLARQIDGIRASLRAEGIEPLIAGGHWTLPGALGFYMKDQPAVYCLESALGGRHSQYDLWRPNPVRDSEAFRGETFILVGVAPEQAYPFFEAVEPPRRVIHEEADHPLAVWHVTVARGFKGHWEERSNAPRY